MDRRRKLKLFEQLRREYEFGVGTIKGVAGKFGVHRRLVRQALVSGVAVFLPGLCERHPAGLSGGPRTGLQDLHSPAP
jgi:hypothetical protein